VLLFTDQNLGSFYLQIVISYKSKLNFMVIKNCKLCKALCTGHFTTAGGDAVISQQPSSLEGRELIALTCSYWAISTNLQSLSGLSARSSAQ
jgi:hypothetical protein